MSSLKEPRENSQSTLESGTLADLRGMTIPFQMPILMRSLAQLANSFGGFWGTCAVMYLCVGRSLWITLLLSPLAAGFLIRIFIIQHDCGHGSFFRSRWANTVTGSLCSLMTLTPYAFWRLLHARHHGSWNNLDRRAELGLDMYASCVTLDEYRELNRWQKYLSRLVNHPIISHVLLPPLVFIFVYRVPFDPATGSRRDRRALYFTDLALGVLICVMGLALGYGRVAEVQMPIMALASVVGVWLFTVQHRFEQTLWTSDKNWDFAAAVLHGSSHLHLPGVLQWFTGNIGFHHVHHLNSRIPNYRLEECHDACPNLRSGPRLTLGGAIRMLRYPLWDNDLGRMVGFPSTLTS
jgi:acyl-lipid omega-6 desaturase (Delta-12 desaturase)